MKKRMLLLSLCSILSLCASESDAAANCKLIKMGWDSQTPDYIAANIQEMEKQPFDGIRIKLSNWRQASSVFNPEKYPEELMQEDFVNLSKIKWGKFTDNFIGIITCKPEHKHQDWFDDKHWEAILHNIRLVSKAAKIGRCTGIAFDPEAYGWAMWSYRSAIHSGTKSFKEYKTQVAKRGRQFAEVVLSEIPDAKVLMLIATEKLQFTTKNGEWSLDAEKCFEASSDALLLPFIEGMLEVANGNFEIIDGNEMGYYYEKSEEYINAAKRVHENVPNILLEQSLRDKYKKHVKLGASIYLDEYFAMRPKRTLISNFMNEEERLQWLEHNIYWAFKTTDKYVWIWDEGLNWWTSKGIPHGTADAITSGREKALSGKPLGIDFNATASSASRKWENEFLKNTKFPISVQLYKLDEKDHKPVIDGIIDDPVWNKAKSKIALTQIYTRKHKSLHANTYGKIAFDSKNLYIMLGCMDKLWKIDKKIVHLAGDSVRITLSEKEDASDPIIIDIQPDGKCDLKKGGQTYNLDSFCKIGTDDNGWIIEASFPFEKLFDHQPSNKLYADIFRFRQDRGEKSSWIPAFKDSTDNCKNGIWLMENTETRNAKK